jgi:hypothetical protein
MPKPTSDDVALAVFGFVAVALGLAYALRGR